MSADLPGAEVLYDDWYDSLNAKLWRAETVHFLFPIAEECVTRIGRHFRSLKSRLEELSYHLQKARMASCVYSAIKVVCGVGADVAYHRHVMGFYVTAASGLIFFLEITWAITLFVQICVRNDESLCSCCWSTVLAITRGWRRALFYLPLSCILAWKPHSLWLSYVAAGLLAVLSLLHIASSTLEGHGSCQMSNATDSVGESLLNTRPENYDRFEEVLVTEVLDDGVSGPTGRVGDSDGDI